MSNTGATTANKESKTIDYTVSVMNANGEYKSVCIWKFWKRLSDTQINSLISIFKAHYVVLNDGVVEADDTKVDVRLIDPNATSTPSDDIF